jgi:integrase
MQAGLHLDRFSEAEAKRRRAEAHARGIAPRGHTPLAEAIQAAVKVMVAGAPADTIKTYTSISNLFLSFLRAQSWDAMPADELARHHALAYVDHCRIERRVTANTTNNNVAILRGIFQWMQGRGYCTANPWADVKKLPPEAKRRRCFTPTEAQAAIAHIARHDAWLYAALLLEYTCYMRPNEIRLLRVGDVDLASGAVHIRRATSKTGRKQGDRTATIPAAVLPLLRGLLPSGAPASHYVFGTGAQCAASPCSRSRMYKRHQAALARMVEEGTLASAEGLTFYSWKDTGITEALLTMPLVAVQDQAGHTTPAMTLRYRAKPRINADMQAWQPAALKKEKPDG